MTALPLPNVKACVFDAYGTLFDFASAARGCRDVLGDGIDQLTTLWRDKQLQYTWLRATQGKHADFWQVTGDALDFTLETLGIENGKLRDRLMQLYLTLDTFPEVPGVLDRLKKSGMKLAILSNGSPKMLDALVKGAKLEGDVRRRSFGRGRRRLQTASARLSTGGRSSCASRPPPYRSSHRTLGTRTLHRPSECRSFGAIATASAENGCPETRIAK